MSSGTSPHLMLTDLILRMVEVLRYDNTYAFSLLKAVTTRKSAVIMLDGCRLRLRGTEKKDGRFEITVTRAGLQANPNFITDSYTLKRIMGGTITIDHAVVKSLLFVKAPFEDLMNIYRLTTVLLAEGPLNKHLRRLWQEFDETWEEGQHQVLGPLPLEQQKQASDYLLHAIPEQVLLTRIKV